MFSLLDKVFGLDPAKVGNSIAQNVLGKDYAGNMIELVGDVKQDITETVTNWGKAFGFVEDEGSDLDLMVEHAQDRMQPIIEKYRPTLPSTGHGGGFEPPEMKQPDIELMELNQGEQAASNSLTELLYDLKETDGKIGTDFYNLKNEEGLQNMLEVLKDEQWKNEMEMTPIDTELQAKLAAERANPLEMRSIQLESIMPKESELSLSREMAGTNVSPLDLDMYNRGASTDPPAIELMEMKIDLSDLPQQSNSEMSRIQPFEIEATDAFGGSRPIGFNAFMDETYPNFNPDGQMLDDFVMADEVLDTTFSAIGAELGEWAGGLIMGTMDAIVGSAAGMALGAIYMSPVFAISELVPLVTQMASGTWLIPGYDRDMALIDHYDDELQTRLGKYYKLAGEIEGFYVTNPTYVWFRDNGLAGGAYQRDSKVWGYGGMMNAYSWRGTVLSSTGLWKRARILTVQGTSVGLLDDPKVGYWAFLKLGDQETIKTEVEPNEEVCIWFRIGMDGYMLPDTYQVRSVCTLYNLSLLNAMLPGYKPQKPPDSTPQKPKDAYTPSEGVEWSDPNFFATPETVGWGTHDDFVWNIDEVYYDSHNFHVGDRVIYTFDVDGKKRKAHGVITTVDSDMFVLVKYDKPQKIPWLKAGFDIMQTSVADIEIEPENWREEKDAREEARKEAEKAAHDQYLFNQKYKHDHYHPGHRTKQDLKDYLDSLKEPDQPPPIDPPIVPPPNVPPPNVPPVPPKVLPIEPEPIYNPVESWPFMQLDTFTPTVPKSQPVATVLDDTSAFNMLRRRRLPEDIPPTGSEDSIILGSKKGDEDLRGATNMGRINQDKIQFWQTVERVVDDILQKPKEDRQFSFREKEGFTENVRKLQEETAGNMIEILVQGLEGSEDMSEVQRNYLHENYDEDWDQLVEDMVKGIGDYESAVLLVMNVGFFPQTVRNVQTLVEKLQPIEPKPSSSKKADNSAIFILVGVIAVAYFMSN